MTEYLQNKEKGLIGLIILQPELALNLGLPSKCFQNPHIQKVYAKYLHLLETKNSGVTEIEVISELAKEMNDEDFWYREFGDYAKEASYPGMEDSLAEYVLNEYIKRQTTLITSEAGRAVSRGTPVGDVISTVVTSLEGLETLGRQDRPTLAEECEDEIKAIREGTRTQSTGLLTGLGIEALVPGGIPRDKVTVLFGETGTFKTTLKGNLVDHIARSGLVLDFSLEDSALLTRQRALARISGVAYSDIACGSLIDNGSLCNSDSYKNVITIDNVWPPTAEGIVRTARQYRKKGLVAVFVDYITLLDWGKDGERSMLNRAMLTFQRAAKRDRIAYVVVSQINDERLHDRSRADARPILRDLFGSSSLRTACKLAIATYRPGKYGPPKNKYDKELYGEIFAKSPEVYDDIIELWIRKNVLGEDNVPVYTLCNRKTGKMRPVKLEDLR